MLCWGQHSGAKIQAGTTLIVFTDFNNYFVNLLYLNDDVRMVESIGLSVTKSVEIECSEKYKTKSTIASWAFFCIAIIKVSKLWHQKFLCLVPLYVALAPTVVP